MGTHANAASGERCSAESAAVRPGRPKSAPAAGSRPEAMLRLQRQAGNAAACALLASYAPTVARAADAGADADAGRDAEIGAKLGAVQGLRLADLLGHEAELATLGDGIALPEYERICVSVGGVRLRVVVDAVLAKRGGKAWSDFVTAYNKDLSTLPADQVAAILAYLDGPADLDLPEGLPPAPVRALPELAARIGRLLGLKVDRLAERAAEELDAYNIPDILKVLTLLGPAQVDALAAHAAVRPLVQLATKAVKDPKTITDAELAKGITDPGQLARFRSTFHPVEDTFLPALKDMCTFLGCEPEHMLAVMLSETGKFAKGPPPFGAVLINPAAGSGHGASGLNQMTEDTQRAQGFTGGSPGFRELNATQQLKYTRSFFTPAKGRLNTVGRVYAWNFLSSEPRFKKALAGKPIASRGEKFYDEDHNGENLDKDGDGSITIADLEIIAGAHVGDAERAIKTLEDRAKAPR